MSMTHFENYMANYVNDKAFDMLERGDKRSLDEIALQIIGDHVDELFAENEKLKEENEKLKINLGVCQKDYWFMSNLLEKYNSDVNSAAKDCVERMKFRKPIFNMLGEL